MFPKRLNAHDSHGCRCCPFQVPGRGAGFRPTQETCRELFLFSQSAGLLLKPRPIRNDSHVSVASTALMSPRQQHPGARLVEAAATPSEERWQTCPPSRVLRMVPHSQNPGDPSGHRGTHDWDCGRKMPLSASLPLGRQGHPAFPGPHSSRGPTAAVHLGVLRPHPQPETLEERCRKERGTLKTSCYPLKVPEVTCHVQSCPRPWWGTWPSTPLSTGRFPSLILGEPVGVTDLYLQIPNASLLT